MKDKVEKEEQNNEGESAVVKPTALIGVAYKVEPEFEYLYCYANHGIGERRNIVTFSTGDPIADRQAAIDYAKDLLEEGSLVKFADSIHTFEEDGGKW